MSEKKTLLPPGDNGRHDSTAGVNGQSSTNGNTQDASVEVDVLPLIPAFNSDDNGTKPHSEDNGEGSDLAAEARSQQRSEENPANRFRSNVEGIEKPRQIVVLVATIAGASYLGFSQDDDDPDSNTKAATLGVSLIFLVHCFLQCRDSLFVRPHPGVWRVIHGLGMLYLFAIAVLLFHPKDEARRLLMIFIPDVKGYKLSKADLIELEPLQCDLTVGAVLSQLREVWFLAHLVGWWCKMCLFRDWGVCWVLSIGFELLELSMGWLVPQFHECWWDSLVIDLLGANLIGMTLGLFTLRFLETRTYDWNKKEESHKLARSLRLLSKFSPFRWSKWRWQAFSSFKRTAQVFAMVAVTMLLELNAFMVMNALEIPKTSHFNYVRLAVLFLVAVLACSEYYEYCSNPSCDRLGQNLWLILAILQVEILTWIKFFPQPLLEATSPDEIKLPWLATLSLFSLWGLLFIAVSEESNSDAAIVGELRQSVTSAPLNEDSVGSADESSAGAPEAKDGNPRRRDSFLRQRIKRQTAVEVFKWGAVDAVFVLSFVPLLYLVKQWSY